MVRKKRKGGRKLKKNYVYRLRPRASFGWLWLVREKVENKSKRN